VQKPKELMSAQERAEASTPWREHAAPDGRKYFYNKDTKESKWTLPDELRVRAHAHSRVAQLSFPHVTDASRARSLLARRLSAPSWCCPARCRFRRRLRRSLALRRLASPRRPLRPARRLPRRPRPWCTFAWATPRRAWRRRQRPRLLLCTHLKQTPRRHSKRCCLNQA
jgi:hypothetical protein